jgi:DNA-binding transcriptional ArsR family regulator
MLPTIFKALADPSRRRLLDKLFKSDDQTLGDLEAHLPEMTRFGVMKHLRVLDQAGLVSSHKIGRIDPPSRLVYTFSVPYNEETRKDRPSRVTWQIEKRGETCKLTLTHDDFDGETATFKAVRNGWNPILSGLKTLLETGKPLVISAA